MRSRDKKLAVLHQLSQESEPISLKPLLKKPGKGFVERSVRRWLTQMIGEGLVEKQGQKRGTRYRVIQRLQRDTETVRSCFGVESEKILQQLKRPLYERAPVTYSDEWFESYRPNRTFYIPSQLRAELHKAGKRSSQQEPAGTYARHIFNRLLIDLSYNSSRLEGNTYSLLDTRKLLLEGASAKGKLDDERVMILNHKEAIRYLVDHAQKLEVNKETIYTLHYLLADGLVDIHLLGKIRNYGVRIGSSTYIPFEDPKEIQVHFDRIVEKAAAIEDPYEQSLFLLIHISYLQPFVDVNKRTSRLSANIPLIKNNLVPLSFNDVERSDYILAVIAVYELQNVRPMLDVYMFSYMRTCALYEIDANHVAGLGLTPVELKKWRTAQS